MIQAAREGARLTALPDRLRSHRLAGAREILTELGLNPLMVETFRDRDTPARAIGALVDTALRPAD